MTQELAAFRLADQVEVPQGVVEDDQDVGQLVQGGEDFGEPLASRACRLDGVLLEGLHPLGAGGAGQVVDAEVEGLIAAVGHGPLDGDGNVAGGGDGAQQHGRVDVVVVGEGDQRLQAELLFDLAAFEIEGQPGGQRRRPVGVA